MLSLADEELRKVGPHFISYISSYCDVLATMNQDPQIVCEAVERELAPQS